MPTKQEATNDDKKLIKATLTDPKEIERFLSLVQMSGLSQAEYIRRCCLNEEIIVAPQEHLNLYAQLGEVQVMMKNIRANLRKILAQEKEEQGDGDSPSQLEQTISNIEERIREVKELRMLLIGIQTEDPKLNN
jgi:hypothetical protein